MKKSTGRADMPSLDGHWSRLSDEELISTTFTSGDPESLPGLVLEVPPPDQRPMIEYVYDFKGTKRANIRCVHCKFPNHLKGFVLKLTDDRRFLVGHECGGKIYGAHFDVLKGDFDWARERALLLKRMDRLTVALPAFNNYLFKIRTHPSVLAFSQLRASFSKDMPRLWGELAIACHFMHGELRIDRNIPDSEAEKRADEDYQRDLAEWNSMSKSQRKKYYRPLPPVKPIYKTITELAGHVPTPTFFGTDCFSKLEFDAIATQFQNLSTPYQIDEQSLSVYHDRAKYDSTERSVRAKSTSITAYMKQTLWQANALLDKLDEQIARLSEPLRLFHRSTLEIMCRWANEHPKLQCNYAVVGKAIQQTDPDGIVRTLALPDKFIIMSNDGIETFRRTINLIE